MIPLLLITVYSTLLAFLAKPSTVSAQIQYGALSLYSLPKDSPSPTCSGTPPKAIIFTSNACNNVSCSRAPYTVSDFDYAVSGTCTFDATAFSATQFGQATYVTIVIYNDQQCSNNAFLLGVVSPADGSCLPNANNLTLLGSQKVVYNSDKSVTFSKYSSFNCTGSADSTTVPRDKVNKCLGNAAFYVTNSGFRLRPIKVLPDIPQVPTIPTIPTINTTDVSTGVGTDISNLGNTIQYQLNAQQGILGFIAIGIGFFFLIMGFKLWKPTIFLAGLVAAGSLTYLIMIRLEPGGGYANRDTVLLATSLGVGIVGGFIMLCLRKLGLAAVGGIGGYALSLFILGFQSYGLIQSGVGRAIFIGIVIIICILLVFFIEKHVVIISTSLAGAYLVIFGIDMYAHVGFKEASQTFFASGASMDYALFVINPKVIAMTASVGVLFLIGIIVQYRMNRGKSFFGDK
ncbi:hypothetical protein HDV05_007485 [Chytridiales sp. JEL 0842]|nr:hypothetical protein HDV05_007485 [Chytridiales sp. JEL 0842]